MTAHRASPRSWDPPRRFGRWLAAARRAGARLPEAACLSTVGSAGRPEGRMVLLKGFDQGGFVFYTSLLSRKARALRSRPRAALTFHWEALARQVCIEGRTRLVSAAEADAYFATRPRPSQIAAWASRQSATLTGRAELLRRYAAWARRFRGGPVPRPGYWTGFRLIPDRVEFWRGRPDRLHDRRLYLRRPRGRWALRLLNP